MGLARVPGASCVGWPSQSDLDQWCMLTSVVHAHWHLSGVHAHDVRGAMLILSLVLMLSVVLCSYCQWCYAHCASVSGACSLASVRGAMLILSGVPCSLLSVVLTVMVLCSLLSLVLIAHVAENLTG